MYGCSFSLKLGQNGKRSIMDEEEEEREERCHVKREDEFWQLVSLVIVDKQSNSII